MIISCVGCDVVRVGPPGEVFDAGPIFAGAREPLTHRYQVTNTTGRTVRILDESHSCTCTKVEVEKKTLQPGESWFVSGFHYTDYNHCQTPNGPIPDCAFMPFDDINFKRIQEGVFTATSRHPGGVNTLFMDGSVHFVKDSVALSIWRAWATRSGGEVVSADAY